MYTGGEEQIETFTDSKGKSEEKNIEPWGAVVPRCSGSCPATRGSVPLGGPRWRLPAGDGAAALVPLGAGAGVVGAVLLGRGQTDHPGGLQAEPWGVGSPPLQFSIPLPGCPKGFLAIHPAPLCVPVPCGAVWWQLAELWRACLRGVAQWGRPSTACWQAAPISAVQSPCGWAGRALPVCPSPAGYHSTSHPGRAAPWGRKGLPTEGILPNPAVILLWSPLGGCCLGRGTWARGDGSSLGGAVGHAGGTTCRAGC